MCCTSLQIKNAGPFVKDRRFLSKYNFKPFFCGIHPICRITNVIRQRGVGLIVYCRQAVPTGRINMNTNRDFMLRKSGSVTQGICDRNQIVFCRVP